jgi:hypothetical protein
LFLSLSRRSPNQNPLQNLLRSQLRKPRHPKHPRQLPKHLQRPRRPNLQPQVFRARVITRLLRRKVWRVPVFRARATTPLPLPKEWVGQLPVAPHRELDLVGLSIEKEAPGLRSSHALVVPAVGLVVPVSVAPAAVLAVALEVAQVVVPALAGVDADLVEVPLVPSVAAVARASHVSRSARSVKSLKCGRRRV